MFVKPTLFTDIQTRSYDQSHNGSIRGRLKDSARCHESPLRSSRCGRKCRSYVRSLLPLSGEEQWTCKDSRKQLFMPFTCCGKIICINEIICQEILNIRHCTYRLCGVVHVTPVLTCYHVINIQQERCRYECCTFQNSQTLSIYHIHS